MTAPPVWAGRRAGHDRSRALLIVGECNHNCNHCLVTAGVCNHCLVTAGVAQLAVGLLGWRQRLPRNRFAGIRTPATLRSHAALVAVSWTRVQVAAVVAHDPVPVGARLSLVALVLTCSVPGVNLRSAGRANHHG